LRQVWRATPTIRGRMLSAMGQMARYFRANPQAFVLAVICVILGLGTFIAVIIALATAGSSTTTGDPSGAIGLLQALLG
jgi:hypothetical protein